MKRLRGLAAIFGVTLAAAMGNFAFADLPIEKATVAKLTPPNGHRLYVSDFAPSHSVDSKVHVFDGDTLKILGTLPNGSFGYFAVSGDGKTLYNATSYFSRGDHGERTEVLEFFDPGTFDVTGEAVLSPKRAQTIGYRSFLQESATAKYLFVQNATPASSVQVVDLAQKKMVTEIPTAGCFGIYPSSKVDGRFSTLCGDGSVVTITFDATLKETSRKRSEKLFDPTNDALFITGLPDGDKTIFMSFLGNVHEIDTSGDVATQAAPWSIVGKADAATGWRPGGYQMMSFSKDTGQLYVCMHPHGKEGSHKSRAKQIWKIDLAKHTVATKGAGNEVAYLQVSAGPHPLLFGLDPDTGIVTKFNGDTVKKLAATAPHGIVEGGGTLSIQ